jgi:hypothetical protein
MEFSMKKLSLLALFAIGLSAVAGCTAPVDGADDTDDDVGEAEQAWTHVKVVPCDLTIPSLGQVEVEITNNTGAFIFEGAVSYTVYHFSSTATYHRSNLPVGSLTNGQTVTFNASSDPNALSASHCTATLAY